MKLNRNFWGGGGVQSEKSSVREIWIFSGTTQCNFNCLLTKIATRCSMSRKGIS